MTGHLNTIIIWSCKRCKDLEPSRLWQNSVERRERLVGARPWWWIDTGLGLMWELWRGWKFEGLASLDSTPCWFIFILFHDLGQGPLSKGKKGRRLPTKKSVLAMHHHTGVGGGRPITTDFMHFFWKQRWNRAWRSDWGSCQMKKRITCKEAAVGRRESSGWICLRDLYSWYFLIDPWARLLVAKGLFIWYRQATDTDPTIDTSTLRCQLHLRPWGGWDEIPQMACPFFDGSPLLTRILVDKCLMRAPMKPPALRSSGSFPRIWTPRRLTPCCFAFPCCL